jgi:hypothetical protein
MKRDPGMHIGLHLVFFEKTGMTGSLPIFTVYQPGGRHPVSSYSVVRLKTIWCRSLLNRVRCRGFRQISALLPVVPSCRRWGSEVVSLRRRAGVPHIYLRCDGYRSTHLPYLRALLRSVSVEFHKKIHYIKYADVEKRENVRVPWDARPISVGVS